MTEPSASPARRSVPQVCLDLPEAWHPVPVASHGDPQGQRAVLDSWLKTHATRAIAGMDALVTRMTRESRLAARAGVAFAAVLLDLIDPMTADEPTGLLAGSLTVSFRALPGETDPVVAARGTLASLRPQADRSYPTRRLELVGLGGDATRPAVMLREQQPCDEVPGRRLSVTQVLWLVPGSSQLATVAVATPNRELTQQFAQVALHVATSLQVLTRNEVAYT